MSLIIQRVKLEQVKGLTRRLLMNGVCWTENTQHRDSSPEFVLTPTYVVANLKLLVMEDPTFSLLDFFYVNFRLKMWCFQCCSRVPGSCELKENDCDHTVRCLMRATICIRFSSFYPSFMFCCCMSVGFCWSGTQKVFDGLQWCPIEKCTKDNNDWLPDYISDPPISVQITDSL